MDTVVVVSRRDGAHEDLYGRSRETEVLDRLVTDARAGRGRPLVLHGEPGAGKSALLDRLRERAAGVRVLRVNGVVGELELPFAAVQRLCAPLRAGLGHLPPAHRDALATVLGLRGGPAPSTARVGTAVAGLLARTGGGRAVVCLLDDAHLMDRASRESLAAAARRCAGRAAFVFALPDPGPWGELRRFERLFVPALTDRDAHALLSARLPAPLDPRVRDRVVAEAGGNPRALVDAAASVGPAEMVFCTPDEPRGLLGAPWEAALSTALDGLGAPGRELLALAAAEPFGDPVTVLRAAGHLGIGRETVEEAEATGLLVLAPRVHFTTPLLRTAVYARATVAQRRRVHAALARSTPADAAPERRAWHRGQAAVTFDEAVAAQLQDAAERMDGRGGATTAALWELAASLTADRQTRALRLLAGARARHRTGALRRALHLLTDVHTAPLPALERAQAAVLRAQTQYGVHRDTAAVRSLTEAARHAAVSGHRHVREVSALDALSAQIFAGRLRTPQEPVGAGEALIVEPGGPLGFGPATPPATAGLPEVGTATPPTTTGHQAVGTATAAPAAVPPTTDGPVGGGTAPGARPTVAAASRPGGPGQLPGAGAAVPMVTAAPPSTGAATAAPAAVPPATDALPGVGTAPAGPVGLEAAPCTGPDEPASADLDAFPASSEPPRAGSVTAGPPSPATASAPGRPPNPCAPPARDGLPLSHARGLLLEALHTRLRCGYAPAVPLLRRAVDAHLAAGPTALPHPDGNGNWLVCHAAVDLWDAAAWESLAGRTVDAARSAGATSVLPAALVHQAFADLHRGRLDRAAARVAEADAISAAIGAVSPGHAALTLAAWRGEGDRTAALAASCRRDAEARGEGRLLSAVEYAEAVLHNALGGYARAFEVIATAAALDEPASRAWVLPERLEAAVRTGHLREAEAVAERLANCARLTGSDWAHGIRLRALALLTDDPRADAFYRGSAQRLTAAGAALQAARTRLLWGEWLRRNGQAARARVPLRAAHEAFVRAGARGFAERAAGELAAAGARPGAEAPGTGAALTAQEERIARLVARGATTKEVAAALVLSPRTVDAHLRNIFRKLGISSRRRLRDAAVLRSGGPARPGENAGR
ncbi:AAA family ATPase [Streptomyces griseosporeus]|uniref:AAA family ATPase n=1 Tax=Streptomyces griseosporeus TaxID=1910 RepID=UPI0036FA3585